MSAFSEQELAVRNYLAFLSDPESLRDDEAIADLEEQLAVVVDPLEELAIRDKLEALRALSEGAFIGPFIQHAAAYAERVGLSASGFESMGVDPKVLRQAGVLSKTPYVKVESVIEIIKSSGKEEFTQPQVIELTGAAPGTVQKALSAMIEEGSLVKTDERNPDHVGRGNRARLYRMVAFMDNELARPSNGSEHDGGPVEADDLDPIEDPASVF